jgi:hypothetical protein
MRIMDGDILSKLMAACVALLSTFMLAACGPGAGDASGASNASVSSDSADSGQSMSRYQSAALQLSAGASVPLAQLQAPPLTGSASGSAIASAQASVAADAIQVAPVMRFAPGDSAN